MRVSKGVVVLAHDQGTALVAGPAYRAQVIAYGPVASRGRFRAFLPGKDGAKGVDKVQLYGLVWVGQDYPGFLKQGSVNAVGVEGFRIGRGFENSQPVGVVAVRADRRGGRVGARLAPVYGGKTIVLSNHSSF